MGKVGYGFSLSILESAVGILFEFKPKTHFFEFGENSNPNLSGYGYPNLPELKKMSMEE